MFFPPAIPPSNSLVPNAFLRFSLSLPSSTFQHIFLSERSSISAVETCRSRTSTCQVTWLKPAGGDTNAPPGPPVSFSCGSPRGGPFSLLYFFWWQRRERKSRLSRPWLFLLCFGPTFQVWNFFSWDSICNSFGEGHQEDTRVTNAFDSCTYQRQAAPALTRPICINRFQLLTH